MHALCGLSGLTGLLPTGFTPDQIAGLKLWLKPGVAVFQDSGFTTAASADGDPAGGWQDQSTAGNHVVQSVSSKRPTLKTASNGINGLSVLRPDVVDDVLKKTGVSGFSSALSGFTLFAALRTGSDVTTYHSFLGLGVSGSGLNAADFRVQSGKLQCYVHNAGVSGGRAGTTSISSNAAYLAAAVFTSGAYPTLYVNGASEGTTAGTAQSFASGTWDLSVCGNLYVDSGQYGSADLGEILAYDSALSASDVARVFGYLNGRWNIY